MFGQLLAHAFELRLGLVNFVNRDDQRHLGVARVVYRLDRLRHHAVVGRHHQNHEIGGLGTAGAHGGERLVAGCVEKGDDTSRCLHVIRADVLGNAAGFAAGDLGLANVVEQ